MQKNIKKTNTRVQIWRVFAIGGLLALVACGSPTPPKPVVNLAAQAIENQLARLASVRYANDAARERAYVADSVDVFALQASPLRDRFLHTWLHLYPTDAELLPHARELIRRAQQDTIGTVRKPLVQALCTALLQDTRDEAAIILAAYSRGFLTEQGEQSEIAQRMLRQITLPGQPAPPIVGLDPAQQPATSPTGGTLVVFYESDCPNCILMLHKLMSCYDDLQARGTQVITISVDTAPGAYTTLAASLPWPNKICDFKGFAGDNPIRWGVAATPAVYTVSATGIVTSWTDDVTDDICNL